MNKLKIEVKVSLPSGANVVLTEKQTKEVTEAVTQIVFTDTEPEQKRTYTKRVRNNNKTWSEEEIAALHEVLENPPTTHKELTRTYKRLANQFGRTRNAVYQKIYELRSATQTRHIPVTRIPITRNI